jgi:uncharacterized protein YjiS (DUF1127 family)
MNTFMQRIAAAVQAWRAWRKLQRERREFERLDERTLRDLGVSRSEFESCRDESRGRVELTRTRIALCSH